MKIFLQTLLFSTLLLVSSIAMAEQKTIAKQAYIIDYETGQVLFHKNENEHMPTSSMSKVMTMHMIFDSLKAGVIDLDTKFKVSEKAWKKGGSKMFVEVGKDVKVKDLIQGVIVQSGNDATIVLAEGLEGSERAFASKMTKRAMEIGMENSNFVNASGWPDEGHYSTARDLSVMTRSIIEEFPEYYKYFAQREYTYNNIKQQNRNPILYRDIGADGLKTGHTEIAGYGLIGTAKQEGRRVIMVLNGLKSEKERANEGTRLISWALNHFENIDLIKANQEISQLPVVMGKAELVAVGVHEDIKLTVSKMDKKNISINLNYNGPLVAPVKVGDEIGTLSVSMPNMEEFKAPLYAMNDVDEVGFFKKTWSKVKTLILGKI